MITKKAISNLEMLILAKNDTVLSHISNFIYIIGYLELAGTILPISY